jgi:hypothetical protein
VTGPHARLAKVLVAKFAVPEDDNRSDEELLDAVVQLATEPRLVQWRADFHTWLADITTRGISDERIAREMGEKVDAYNRMVRERSSATVVRQGAAVMAGGAGVGAAVWGGPLAAAAKVPVSTVGNIVAGQLYDESMHGGLGAAALLAEARRRLD